MSAVSSAARKSGLVWYFMRLSLARRAVSLAGFGLLYATLMITGLALRESSQQLVIIWPAAGLLFVALRFSPRRNWIWIVVVQVAVEIVIDVVRFGHFIWYPYGLFILANSIDGIVGALVANRLVATPEIPRVRHALQFFAAVALGSAASAVVGGFASAAASQVQYLHDWQLWWAGNWL